MCGRYGMFSSLQEIAERFRVKVPDFEFHPNYNAAPTQMLPVIISERDETKIELMKWGLIPSWAEDMSFGSKAINARAETITEKPSFRKAIKERRSIVPVNGFYEWQKTGNGKQPVFISLKSEEIFALAGLWEIWKSKEGKVVRSFTIITTEPNELTASIHDRMPAIIPINEVNIWLSNELPLKDYVSMLKPYHSDEMTFKPVSKLLNSPTVNVPELLDQSYIHLNIDKDNKLF